jgi:hypothetical protein
LHCLLIYYTCDVNICVEMDPGTHMVCARFYPLEPGVTVFRLQLKKMLVSSTAKQTNASTSVVHIKALHMLMER